MQLLTGDHLNRATSLSDWDVEQLTPDRYLVTSRHLDGWFAKGPTPEILANAREDFGEMIATDNDLQ